MKKSKIKNQNLKLQPKIKNFSRQSLDIRRDPAIAGKFWIAFLIFAFCILHFIGCASLKEAAKGVAGISTKILEESRKDAVKKTFSYDYQACYDKVKSILREKGSYIYRQDPKENLIAIYVSEADTTPVGIFFTGIDANNTQIEVSSPSTAAKELISARIFSALEGK
jgi:hypothetical protein